METVLTLLVNDLDRGLVDRHHVVLVLDDYQVITSAPVHYALSFLLDLLPSQMHLVLATREDPPLSLARLRGRDALVELRTADLQFTQEETATYLVEVMGLPFRQRKVRSCVHAPQAGSPDCTWLLSPC